jgi:NitT/TauT family transport system substrate-binding protein
MESSAMTWTRRRLIRTGALSVAALAWRARAGAQALRPVTIAHSVSTFVYGQHLVAREKRFFEEEGLSVPSFIVSGSGMRTINAVTSGQAMFGMSDSHYPLKALERGRETLLVFATDRRCSYGNIVVRKELYERGVRSVEALADIELVGRKAVVAATAIGSGTYVYGVYVLKQTRAADGKPVNDHIEWVGGGASQTMLGGLRAGKFDAIMAGPEWRWAAEREGFGKTIYDVLDEKAWNRVFGGPIPVTVGYVLHETIDKSPDLVQAYVNAIHQAQQWIRRAKDDEIVDLVWKPYMDTFKREDVLRSVKHSRVVFDWDLLIQEKDYDNGINVWVPTVIGKSIPYAKAVDASFVRKAQAKHTS